jgi:hypothetical protein
MSESVKCELCGEPMPPGEEMFKFHGYSGNCPKPPKADAPFQSEPAEKAYQKMRQVGGMLSRDQFRLVLQTYETEQEKSRREYEAWRKSRETP